MKATLGQKEKQENQRQHDFSLHKKEIFGWACRAFGFYFKYIRNLFIKKARYISMMHTRTKTEL